MAEISPTGSRIASLDGWRAVAILLVLEAHFVASYMPTSNWPQLGLHGVQIFFVLSGYLITTTLLREDRIDLPGFYLRRFFRLMPAAWSYLIALGLLTWLTPMHVLDSSIWSCLLFYRNYLPETAANTCTMHFWSLSLEEQFYLVWPPLLLWIGSKRAALCAAIACIAVAFYRGIFWHAYLQHQAYWHTEVRADALLTGCLLAFLLEKDTIAAWFRRNGRIIFWCALPLLICDFLYASPLQPLHESVLIAMCLAATALNPGMLPSRVLELQHIKFTGQASYSIYLWQGLFFRANWSIWGMLLFPAAFLISWLCIERPCRRFGRALAAKWNAERHPIHPPPSAEVQPASVTFISNA